MNWALILINIGAFYYEFTLPPDRLEALVGRWGVVPLAYHPGNQAFSDIVFRLPSLFTSMFLHGGLDHLFGNMLFLWIFGDNIEDRLGHLGYVCFYLVCGLTAAIVQILWDLDSAVPVIGASGAIGGVMGAYMLLYPHAQVLTLFFLIIIVRFIWVPAIVYLGVWFVIQLVEALSAEPGMGAGVAFWAHVGGFVAGLVWAGLVGLTSRRKRAGAVM